VNRERLARRIQVHEGYRREPYLDSKGYLTVGWGHLIHHVALRDYAPEETLGRLWARLTDRAWHDAQFEVDLNHAVRGAQRYAGLLWELLTDIRQEVLAEMSYQMGTDGLAGFKDLRVAIDDEDWHAAQTAMLDSKWAREDSPGRAQELAEKFLIG
jgi:lysozyme